MCVSEIEALRDRRGRREIERVVGGLVGREGHGNGAVWCSTCQCLQEEPFYTSTGYLHHVLERVLFKAVQQMSIASRST